MMPLQRVNIKYLHALRKKWSQNVTCHGTAPGVEPFWLNFFLSVVYYAVFTAYDRYISLVQNLFFLSVVYNSLL